ncbi:MAG: ribonuclease [Sphingomicrobium sp.]
MPEWLVGRGIGETRAALVEDDEIIEARIELEDAVPAGSVVTAKLISGGRNAIAVAGDGFEYLLPKGAPGVTEGASLTIEVTREAIPGAEPWKRPLAKVSTAAATAVPLLADRLSAREIVIPGGRDELGEAGWDELIDQARTGIVSFAGGELRISPTPAMTLIDVDGHLPPDQLAILGAAEAARAIRRLDIGGSIGFDLPTAGSKATRIKAAEAIDTNLPQPFERTAVNGFGFVQIVRPRHRASLIELAQDRAPFEARALLRRAALEAAGAKRLVAPPGVISVLQQRADWVERLSQQLGGAIGLRADPALPMSGGYAE